MSEVRNILFIMCDQLRWDYLSCYGHPRLATPNIDTLAARGVRFDRAFVQSASCGPSRMSYYTGRYVSSHRAFGNFVPLPIDERTMGDHLRPLGLRVALNGKSHAEADVASMRLRGIDPFSPEGILLAEAGFEPFDRHDGVIVDGAHAELASNLYTRFLRSQGYDGPNPWLYFANSGIDASGQVLSGWEMRHASQPARVLQEHSETAYSTRRAIEFIGQQGDAPWCLHLSYIKPHWPYVAPYPYNDMYRASDVVPPLRHPKEQSTAHPIFSSYQRHAASLSFSRAQTRNTVIPVYMGLVKQIDDQLGELFDFLDAKGRWSDTMVVFCSDHGDYLGDHYLGEKELFHDTVNRIPLIVYDPRSAANATRGRVDRDHFVESVDLLPTFIDALGARANFDRIEGCALTPILHGKSITDWREFTVSEFDYSFRTATRRELGRPIKGCGITTLRDHNWKYVECDGMRPLLFNLREDPDEFSDLGGDSGYADVLESYRGKLAAWRARSKCFTSANDRYVDEWLGDQRFSGMQIGVW